MKRNQHLKAILAVTNTSDLYLVNSSTAIDLRTVNTDRACVQKTITTLGDWDGTCQNHHGKVSWTYCRCFLYFNGNEFSEVVFKPLEIRHFVSFGGGRNELWFYIWLHVNVYIDQARSHRGCFECWSTPRWSLGPATLNKLLMLNYFNWKSRYARAALCACTYVRTMRTQLIVTNNYNFRIICLMLIFGYYQLVISFCLRVHLFRRSILALFVLFRWSWHTNSSCSTQKAANVR